MNCKEFESLLADALGDELSSEDRPAFEEHLADCQRCRLEFESTREAVAAMRALPGPQRVSVRREGNRLVIQDDDRTGPVPRGLHRGEGLPPVARWTRGVFRYAASVLIAFTAGYIAHAALVVQETPIPRNEIVKVPGSKTLGGALVSAYTRNAARSDLAKALIAMAKPNR
jgi:anti-sigma factor RsiW